MNEKNIIFWKEKLKENWYYESQCIIYFLKFKTNTFGKKDVIKNNALTKEFIDFILKQPHGAEFLDEFETRKVDYEKSNWRIKQ